MLINQITSRTFNDTVYFTADANFVNTLESNVKIKISDNYNSDTRYGNIQSKRSKQVDYETLSKCWNIYLSKANNTVTRTTQRGVWSCLQLILGRRYPTNYQMLRYKHMPDPVFSDTLKAGTMYKCRNVYGKSHSTIYEWSCCHPMQKKCGARDTLYLMSKRY